MSDDCPCMRAPGVVGLPWPCAPHPFDPPTFGGPDGMTTADWCGHMPGGLTGEGICGELAGHPVHRGRGMITGWRPPAVTGRLVRFFRGGRVERVETVPCDELGCLPLTVVTGSTRGGVYVLAVYVLAVYVLAVKLPWPHDATVEGPWEQCYVWSETPGIVRSTPR